MKKLRNILLSGAMATTLTACGGGGSGDITSVVAGFGLSGGATSGDATLNVDTGSLAGLGLTTGSGSSSKTSSGTVIKFTP